MPTLGITSFAMAGSQIARLGQRPFTAFDSEPEILGIGVGTAADGVLEEGDWIVAIDDHLITTPGGALRYSTFAPGEQVRLLIRRNGETVEAALVAGWYCDGDAPKSRPRPARNRGTTAIEGASDLPDLLPRGWLGIGLECAAQCRMIVDRGADGQPAYRFQRQAPVVSAIAAESPAARAGMEPGDVIVAINGHALLTDAGGQAYSAIRPGQVIQLRIERRGQVRTLTLTVGTRDD